MKKALKSLAFCLSFLMVLNLFAVVPSVAEITEDVVVTTEHLSLIHILGLDRLCMQMLGCETLRDVTAFPKVQNASELMTECPATVDDAQLCELGIAVTEREEQ